MKIDLSIAEKLAEKVNLVTGKDIVVSNENGFILLGENKGEFSSSAYKGISDKKRSDDTELGAVWAPILYEGTPLGAFGIKDRRVSDDNLYLVQGMAEVLVYQEFLVNNLFSVTNIRTNFIKELLLTENIKTMDEAMAQADVLKINLRANQAAIVIHIEDFANNFFKTTGKLSEEQKKLAFIDYSQSIELMIKKAFSDLDQNVVVYFNDNKFVVLKGMGEIEKGNYRVKNSTKFFKQKSKYLYDLLKKEYKKQEITMGIGQYYPGIEGLRKSFQDANLALDVGIKVWGKGDMYHILDVGTFVSLSGEVSHQRKSEIAEQVLGPLLDNEDLFKTVQVFLSSGMNLTIASKELHVHRNTLIYRLNKVRHMIGLDPKKFHDALQIKLGFMMRSISG